MPNSAASDALSRAAASSGDLGLRLAEASSSSTGWRPMLLAPRMRAAAASASAPAPAASAASILCAGESDCGGVICDKVCWMRSRRSFQGATGCPVCAATRRPRSAS